MADGQKMLEEETKRNQAELENTRKQLRMEKFGE